MAIDRNLVVPLIEKYLPKSGALVGLNTVGMTHICKDFLGGVGTTCGFLPHWLLWRLGCKDTTLVNRKEPDTKFTYKDGLGVELFRSHRQFTHLAAPNIGDGVRVKGPNDEAFLNLQIYPKTGDAVIIQGNKTPEGNYTSHIFIVLDEGIWDPKIKGKGKWRVAETGQGLSDKEKKIVGGRSGHIATRKVEFKGGRWWVSAGDMAATKWMIGWFNIDNLDFGPPLKSHEYLSSFVANSVDPAVDQLIGRWEISSSNGEKWIYFFYKGFRCFYAKAAAPGQFKGAGHWLPKGDGYIIHWDLYAAETINNVKGNASSGTASGKDSFGPFTAKKTSPGQMYNFTSTIGVR